MSGHSKWAQIKRQKGANDAKKGQMFTKLGREIAVAAREGGGDPEANFRLRLAIQRARDSNMPMDNIERAIKRATGGSEGVTFEEITYEGYGPGGVAIMVEAMTDNRNRTVGEVRNVFTRNGGSLGESGCVAWIFEPRGVISVDATGRDVDDLALLAIDAGAEDVESNGTTLEVYTNPADVESVRAALTQKDINVLSAESDMVPKTTVDLDENEALRTLKLMDKLEDLDDIQRVYANVDFPEEILEKYAG